MGMTLAAGAQKSRVLSVFQMIESEKYEEAKEAVELAISSDKTSGWARTYYAKGFLCQTAFEAGFEKNETKKTHLYEDQLVVAYVSYQKALELDRRERLGSSISKHYYALANDFQKLGRQYYTARAYDKAFSAFEHALLLVNDPLLSVAADTNLIYNTAMAAFEAGKWDNSIGYLNGLNDDGFSPNAALLLYSAMMNSGDSLQAEQVLEESLDRYDYDRTLVLQLVDRLVVTEQLEKAVTILDTAEVHRPEEYHFPWTRGLVYQRMGYHEKATESLRHAIDIAPEEVEICYDLGICYYNQGVEINESAREIQDNREYLDARESAMEEFRNAVNWLEKAYELEPENQQVISRLYQLYYRLQMTEKQKSLEPLIR